MKPIFIMNAGSSSLKFSIIDVDSEKEYLSGIAQSLGLPDARISWVIDSIEYDAAFNEKTTIKDVATFILAKIVPEIDDLSHPIMAVGHRIVHGGEKFTEPVIIDQKLIDEIHKVSPLAPLHNPANLATVKAAMAAFTDIPHVAIFDTAFHTSMPERTFLYGIPYRFYRDHQVRRYGFHGSSHGYIAEEASQYLKKDTKDLCIISAHLGNGASIAAIKNGKSVDTSMGMTPLDGLLMGTRSGSIDPSITFYLREHVGMEREEIYEILNTQSGLYGISGVSSDCRKIIAAAQKTGERARRSKLALEMFAYSASKYIASYYVALGRVDALIFTGGIGENNASMRHRILELLDPLGYVIDEQKNAQAVGGVSQQITSDQSRTPAFVITTNEELMIARQTARLVSSQK